MARHHGGIRCACVAQFVPRGAIAVRCTTVGLSACRHANPKVLTPRSKLLRRGSRPRSRSLVAASITRRDIVRFLGRGFRERRKGAWAAAWCAGRARRPPRRGARCSAVLTPRPWCGAMEVARPSARSRDVASGRRQRGADDEGTAPEQSGAGRRATGATRVGDSSPADAEQTAPRGMERALGWLGASGGAAAALRGDLIVRRPADERSGAAGTTQAARDPRVPWPVLHDERGRGDGERPHSGDRCTSARGPSTERC